MEYLTRWRMLVAGDRLKNSDDSISAIALSLCYESESAFGKAFRRVMSHGLLPETIQPPREQPYTAVVNRQ